MKVVALPYSTMQMVVAALNFKFSRYTDI